MKLHVSLEHLTDEQQKFLDSLEVKCNDEESLAMKVVDKDRAWEQWCDQNEDAFTTHRYSEGNHPYYYPAGTVFEEVDGPEGFDDVGEDEIWDTREGNEALIAANTIIDFTKDNIDGIISCDDIDEWLDKNNDLLIDYIDREDADSDRVYTLSDYLFK